MISFFILYSIHIYISTYLDWSLLVLSYKSNSCPYQNLNSGGEPGNSSFLFSFSSVGTLSKSNCVFVYSEIFYWGRISHDVTCRSREYSCRGRAASMQVPMCTVVVLVQGWRVLLSFSVPTRLMMWGESWTLPNDGITRPVGSSWSGLRPCLCFFYRRHFCLPFLVRGGLKQ